MWCPVAFMEIFEKQNERKDKATMESLAGSWTSEWQQYWTTGLCWGFVSLAATIGLWVCVCVCVLLQWNTNWVFNEFLVQICLFLWVSFMEEQVTEPWTLSVLAASTTVWVSVSPHCKWFRKVTWWLADSFYWIFGANMPAAVLVSSFVLVKHRFVRLSLGGKVAAWRGDPCVAPWTCESHASLQCCCISCCVTCCASVCHWPALVLCSVHNQTWENYIVFFCRNF